MRQVVQWMLTLVLLMSFLAGGSLAYAAGPQEAIQAALSWLEAQQNEDGGFSGGFSPESSVSTTADVILSATAAGVDPTKWTTAGNSPLDYLASQVSQAGQGAGTAAKLTLAAVVTGQDPTDFAGADLVDTLNGYYAATSGQFQGVATDHMWAMLALANAGEEVPPAAVEWLKSVQIEDGSWAFDGSTEVGAGDTNSTALAIQALVAAGEPADSEVIMMALEHLRDQQNDDAGFPFTKPSEFGTESDANSTAFVIQALLATGAGLDDWAVGGNTPMDKLLTFQIEDSGALTWKLEQPEANMLATIQAVPALSRVSLAMLEVVEALNPPLAPVTMPETGGVVAGSSLGLMTAGLLTLVLGLLIGRSGYWRRFG